MTGQELAEWFGVSYNGTYRKNPSKYIAKLDGYCKYTQIRGGVQVHDIYADTYYGDISKQLTKDCLEEIQSKENRLSSVAGTARKFQAENETYAEMKYSTLYYQLDKTVQACFGKTNYNEFQEYEGAYGSRWGVWAIKLDDYNNYRNFTQEEEELFDRIISNTYGSEPKKIKQLAMLEESFKRDEISKQEYFDKKEEYDLDFFGQCITVFRERTGLIIARVQYYDINQESAF